MIFKLLQRGKRLISPLSLSFDIPVEIAFFFSFLAFLSLGVNYALQSCLEVGEHFPTGVIL